jgi:hypothetical protein
MQNSMLGMPMAAANDLCGSEDSQISTSIQHTGSKTHNHETGRSMAAELSTAVRVAVDMIAAFPRQA